jgi:sugar phosphate isomerase/epimerase
MTVPISIQLYTLREAAQQDFPAVLARLGDIGYVGVEPAGLHDLTPAAFRKCVDDAGLVVSGAHIPLLTAENANALLDMQETLGNRDVVVAFLPAERFSDADSVKRVADDLNASNEIARGRGLALGYHNHNWEFAHRIDGRTAHATLFDQLEPGIFAEIDTYWARVGGVDPARVVSDLGERARMLHLKDGPADDPESPMTAVGSGVLDVAAIAAASRADWHVVELDRCATDMFEAVEQSYRFLVENGLARGRARAT